MVTIRFSRNYNGKLDQNVFTTIRDHDKFGLLGAEVEVQCEYGPEIPPGEMRDFVAEVIEAERYDELLSVPDSQLMTDTGLTEKHEIVRLFRDFGIEPDSPVVVLTLEKFNG